MTRHQQLSTGVDAPCGEKTKTRRRAVYPKELLKTSFGAHLAA